MFILKFRERRKKKSSLKQKKKKKAFTFFFYKILTTLFSVPYNYVLKLLNEQQQKRKTSESTAFSTVRENE